MLSFYLSLVLTDDDRNKVAEIYTKFYPIMTYVSEEILKDHKSAVPDVVHDSMLSIIDNLERIDMSDMTRVRNYCVATAKSKCFNYLRKKSEKWETIDLEDVVDNDLTTEDIVISNETVNVVVKTISELGEENEQICLLRFVYGYSNNEISEMIGLNPSTIRTRIERSRKYLKKRLKEELAK